MNIMTTMNSEVLVARDCYKPNCEYSSWSTGKSDELILTDYRSAANLMVQVLLQRSVPVAVQRYSIAYGFSNFVADFGGYLGLLLGASLLSLYDDGVNLLGTTCRKKE